MRLIENLNLKDWLKERRSGYVENWKWGMDSTEQVKQTIAKKFKNWEEFVAKKQIELDKQEFVNCLCIKRGILRLWVSSWLKIRIYINKENSLSDTTEFYVLKQRAALEQPTFPVNPRVFRVPEPCLAAILDCHDARNIVVLQETFLNDYLLEKDKPILSSQIQRIWHPLLKNWDLTLQETQSDQKVKWDENRKIRRYLHHASKEALEYWTRLVELILTMVWWITREFRSRKCILENSQTHWNFKAGRSTSRLKYVQRQQILILQCTGSKKLR